MKKPAFLAPLLVAIVATALAGCGGGGKQADVRVTGSSSLCRVPAGPPLSPASAVSVDKNVVYGSDVGQPLLLDIYRPTGGPRRPAVLVVHSGGWAGGDKSAWAGESAALGEAGFVVFDANYTLSTPTRPGWPLELQDLQAAVRWIRAHAGTYRVDPERIGALGGSAGANLVELLADGANGRCTQGDGIAAVVAWSGPTNMRALDTAALSCLRGTSACGSVGLAALIHPELLRYLACPADGCPQRWFDASPINHVSPGDPPALLFNSSQEVVPLDQVKAYADRLASQRVPHALVVYPGGAHAEAYAFQAIAPTISFLKQHLAG